MNRRMAKQHPLTDDELTQVESLLDELTIQQAADVSQLPLSLDAVDGLMTALVLSPKATSIAQWMALVTADVQFADKEKTQQLRRLLIRHYDYLLFVLRHHQLEHFEPLVAYDDDDCADVAAWAAGFILGFERQENAWSERLDEADWAEIQVLYALRDAALHNQPDAEDDELLDEGELALVESRQSLLDLMRAELTQLLAEPADDVAIIVSAITGLQATMLAPVTVKQAVQSTNQRAKQRPRRG